MDTVLWLYPSLPTETLKRLSSLPTLMQKSFWWWQCSNRHIISLSPHLHTPFSPSLTSLMVSVDAKHHIYLLTPALKQKDKSPNTETHPSPPNLLILSSQFPLRKGLHTNYKKSMVSKGEAFNIIFQYDTLNTSFLTAWWFRNFGITLNNIF